MLRMTVFRLLLLACLSLVSLGLLSCRAVDLPTPVAAQTMPTAAPTSAPTRAAIPSPTVLPLTAPPTTPVPDQRVSGQVMWGAQPVPGARVEARTGAWASGPYEVTGSATADDRGQFALSDLPAGEYGLVALWPDGSVNVAPVTPLELIAGQQVSGVDVGLARELALIEPADGSAVQGSPTLRWTHLPDVALYTLSIIDAGTTALVFDLAITDMAEEMVIGVPPLAPDRSYAWVANGLDGEGNLLAGISAGFVVEDSSAIGENSGGDCYGPLAHRELRQPYQQRDGGARYTLDGEELAKVLADMGIDRLCIPPAIGAPFLNVDWDSAGSPATTGRMISLGFEALYPGQGWSDVYLLYASYDFATGSEYDTFASRRDLEALAAGVLSDLVEIDGVTGFVRYQMGLCYGRCSLFKAVIFPRESGYVALVQRLLDADAADDWEALMAAARDGEYSAEVGETMALANALLGSLRFAPEPPQAMPPLTPDLAYTQVEILEAGLILDVPAGWLRLEPEWAWTPSEGDGNVLGVKWVQLDPPLEPEAALLPDHSQVLESRPVSLLWGEGRAVTLEVYAPPAQGSGAQAPVLAVEKHVLVVVEEFGVRRGIDLYVIAPDAAQLEALKPVLERMLETSVLVKG